MFDLNSGSQLSEMSTISHKFTQVFRIALWWSYLNVFVFFFVFLSVLVFVFVFVFVFVIVIFFFWSGHVSSSLWSNVSGGHKSSL